jgi:hypothetical protein
MEQDARKTTKSQRSAFIAAARAAGCDESAHAFEAKLGRIAKAKPAPPTASAKGRFERKLGKVARAKLEPIPVKSKRK